MKALEILGAILSTPFAVADFYLSKLRAYRRWRGRVWELWWVDHPVCAEVWHQLDAPTAETGRRPSPGCRGTPIVEDHRRRSAGASAA